jgi:hypothetical protein
VLEQISQPMGTLEQRTILDVRHNTVQTIAKIEGGGSMVLDSYSTDQISRPAHERKLHTRSTCIRLILRAL